MTDTGVSALSQGCGQLQSVGCDKVTDAGISALGAGCGQLQSIDVPHCSKVADAGVSALGARCDLYCIVLYCIYSTVLCCTVLYSCSASVS